MTKRILIGDAAEATGLSRATLRRLDDRGLVKPARDLTGNRVYSRNDLDRLCDLAGRPRSVPVVDNVAALKLARALLAVCGHDDGIAHGAIDVIVARSEVQP